VAKILDDIFPNGLTDADFPKELPPQAPDIQLRVAMSDAGIQPPDEIIFDGQLHRFSTSGKPKDKSGWYVAHDGKIHAGAFGDWKLGIDCTWRADIGRELSVAEQMQHSARMREVKIKRDKELAELRENAALQAAEIWDSAQLASDDHPYIQRKGISNPGWRISPDGRLIAPMYIDDEIAGLQYIANDGSKLFMKGSKTGGAWWMIGSLSTDGAVYIVEGVADAATVFEATGKPVAIAYSASNLTAVAQSVRSIVGDARDIVIVADNDESGTGQRESQKAAEAAACTVVMPPETGDINDFYLAGGDVAGLLNPPKPLDQEIIKALDVVFSDQLPDEYTPPDELVQGLLVSGGSSVVYGDSNSGKTFFVLDMCCAIARGVEWLGRKTEPGLVVYLATEAPNSIKTRIQAYQRYHGVVVPNLAIVQMPVNFYTSSADAKAVLQLVKVVEQMRGMPARIIIGDTLARISAGANENSGEDMGPVMARFDMLSKHTGAHMLVIHHNGKDQAKGARGWSGIRAHIDTEIELIEENGQRHATITKQRELPGKNNSIFFKLEVVKMGVTKWGDDANSCVVLADEENANAEEIKKSPEHISDGLISAATSFRDAVLKFGRVDRDNDIYIIDDNWLEYIATVEKMGLSPSSIRSAKKRYKDKLIAAGYIETKNGEIGLRVSMEEKFLGLRLMLPKN